MKRLVFLMLLVLSTWGAMAQVNEPYIIADFKEGDLGTMLELCNKGGFGVLIQKMPFSICGHYTWNDAFAPEGSSSAIRMVATAEEAGVRLGVLVQKNAISDDDSFFSKENFKQFRKEAKINLFGEHDANEITIVLYHDDVFENASSLNLVMIDDEMVKYNTMEYAGRLALLHDCSRGVYGTKAEFHSADAETYKILDLPGGLVVPEGELQERVQKCLDEKLQYFPLFLRKDDPCQERVDVSMRLSLVERWEQMPTPLSSLGWFLIQASEKRRASTTMQDLEWMLSKAAGFQAPYGLTVEPKALTQHGMLDEMLETTSRWNRLLGADAFTEQQRQMFRDPYLDWHLEQQDSIHYLLYQMNYSRRFRCDLQEIDTGLLCSETWTWNADDEGRFGLQIKVEGEVEILNPMVNTTRGLAMFPCVIKPGQRLLYDFGETARVVDADYNTVSEVNIEGLAELDQGGNEVYFLCEVDPETTKRPVVTLRYITRERPETVILEATPNK